MALKHRKSEVGHASFKSLLAWQMVFVLNFIFSLIAVVTGRWARLIEKRTDTSLDVGLFDSDPSLKMECDQQRYIEVSLYQAYFAERYIAVKVFVIIGFSLDVVCAVTGSIYLTGNNDGIFFRSAVFTVLLLTIGWVLVMIGILQYAFILHSVYAAPFATKPDGCQLNDLEKLEKDVQFGFSCDLALLSALIMLLKSVPMAVPNIFFS